MGAALDDVLITHQLASRARRASEPARENDALHALVRDLADTPRHVLQLLVDIALDLCGAGSAGVSVREPTSGGHEIVRWVTLAGQLAPHVGTATPADARSPCGVALTRGAPQLFARPARHFACLADLPVATEELLVVPFDVNGAARGTIWLVSHDGRRPFDAEDARLLTSFAHMSGATVHRLDEDVLREQTLVARAIADHVSDAVFATDAAGAVTFANRGAERLVGWRAVELVGRPLHDLVHTGGGCSDSDCLLVATIRTGAACQHDDVFRRRDGSSVEVSCSSAPVDRGDVTGAIIVARDVSARMRVDKGRVAYVSQLVSLAAAAPTMHSLSLSDALTAITEQARQIIGAHQAATIVTAGPRRREALTTVSLSEKYARHGSDFRPTRGVLSAPLLDRRGETLGRIELSDPYEDAFRAQHETVLLHLAQLASVAIENAELYEDAQSARSSAEAANTAKDQFLAMLAHELHNPLGVILNGLSVLDRSGSQAPEAVRVRGLVRHHAQYLARLLDDLLDLARINQGKIQLRPGVVDLRAVLDITVEAYRQGIEARSQQLSVAMPSGDVHVYGDAARLQQIVGNLLDNASKYTPPGGAVWLTVDVVNDEVLISIRDNGIGIPPDKLESIFDLFTQLEPPVARTDAGLGIGLTVVRRLTEMHGGRVHVHSDGRGTGSEFVVRLRTVRPPAAAVGPTPAARRLHHILLIGANADGRDMLGTVLELEGHHVEVAEDGASGIDVAARRRPDVVLVDLAAPSVDGYEVARRLRVLRGESIRLFAISADGSPDDVRRALDAGFDGHLTKPMDVEEILRLLGLL
jgi:PAS domain S-box-containing protein